MCLGNISKDFTASHMKKTVLNEYIYEFSVDYNIVDTSNFNFHQHLMIKKKWYEIACGIIKKMFMGLLISIVNASNHRKCMGQPTLINLHPNECNREFHFYPFAVKLDKCDGSFNTVNDLCNEIYVPNKTRFKSKRVQHVYRNKWIKNNNKAYIMQI